MTVIRKAKAVMQELHAICGENSWATCCQAAQVLQQQLMDVTAVSIAAQTGSPGTCILAGAYGPGAEWQQHQVFMSGAHWSACACLQHGKPHLYRTGSPEAAATAVADEVWPQDWAYLHKEHGLSTFLAVRIADAHGRPLGVLCLASTATDAYQEEWWEPLLSMVCTSLASLLKSPVMAGLAELAGCLVDTREEFSTLAKAFIQGSAALVEAVTNVRVEVKLGLLSPDAQHVLMLYMTHQEPSGATMSFSQGSVGLFDEESSSLQCGTSSSGGWRPLLTTRVSAADSMLSTAVQIEGACFLCDTAAAFTEGAIPPADDMFTGSQEPVRSIVVIPLLGSSSAFGGVYVTHNEPSSFAESKATIVEVSSLLQSLLLQGLVAPPQDWEVLVQQDWEVLVQQGHVSSSQCIAQPRRLSGCGSGSYSGSLSKSQQSFSGNMLQMLQAEVKQYGKRSSGSKHGDDYITDLQLIRLLGRGGFANVYEARWQGCQTAVKVMYVPQRLRSLMKAAMEMAMTEALSHPNIVRTFACLSDLVEEAGCRESSAPTPSSIRYRRLRAGEVDDEFESVTTCNLIVMELCRMGNLRQALNKGLLHKQVGPGRLTVRIELLLLVLLDIARALEHLHTLNIMHCDVKSSNIFLQHTSGGKGFVCKLADFGLAKLIGEDRMCLTNHSVSGTITNLAPERMLGDKITLAADVFAFGLLMYTVFTGQEPYTGMTPADIVSKVCEGFRPPLPAGMPAAYAEVLNCCWAHEPAMRPRIDLVVQQLQVLLLQARTARQ
ncbi:hypothetical protein OEZ86_002086 [Tetradesmus obliquus]|nr:hypothetical protein OEZ86_002086 [Tetradesmus obliquus]